MLAPGGRRTPTRTSLGTASLSISSLFVFSSRAKPENPVTLPPGRARLATRPAPTGSPGLVITMGMVVVALLAAEAAAAPVTTIRSTLRRTRSAASSSRRSCFCSANRYSMMIFFPSIHPSVVSSCRNAPHRPRYRKQCLDPGYLCGRFSLPAAPRRWTHLQQRKLAVSRQGLFSSWVSLLCFY